MPIGTRARQLPTQSASLNNSRRSENSYKQDKGGFVIEATTIAGVNSTNSFDDSGAGIPGFTAGSLIEVSGLELNSRTYNVVSNDGSTLVVEGSVVTDESAGELVTIRSV